MTGSPRPEPMLCPTPGQRSRLRRQIETFLELSSALGLSQAEERTLLDLTAPELAALRLSLAPPDGADTAKLQRRVEYAIPILRRMLAASLP